jgi:hypothetical protein
VLNRIGGDGARASICSKEAAAFLKKSGAKNFCYYGPVALKPARRKGIKKRLFKLGRAGVTATGPDS